MKKLLKIFAVMFIVSVALLAVAAYVPNGDVADAVTADCTHEYLEVVVAQQPSCTQEGWLEHYTCTLCRKYFVKVGEDMVEVDREDISSPVLVHKWSDWFVKPATCTEEGGEMRYCALCGATEHRGDTIDATGHTVVTDEGKAPTCTETGLTEGSHCSVCNEVLVSQEVIPATGHTYDAVKTENNVCTVCEHEITQAEIVKKLYALESGEALDGTYLLTGIVTNLDGTNATIIVEEKDIYLYSFQSTDAFLVGDSVSVVGTLKHFDNYYEFDAGTVTEVTHPEYTLTFGANVEGYTVTLVDGSHVPTSATNGTTYEVKITVPSGYKVANVTVNGTVVDMSESGTYSVTVCGETTVHVEIVSKMSQQEVALTFPDDNNENNHAGSYIDTWTAIKDGHEWTISNFNNNNWKSWTYIKAGREKFASVATISTHFAEQITKVVVTVDKVTAGKINSFKLIVATDEKFENIVETVVAQEIAAGDMEFVVTAPAEDLYYKIEIDCPVAGSNGIIQISKVTYTSVVCEHEWGTWAHKSDATCTESATESRICDLCGAEEVRTVGEPLGHTWGDWTSNGNGTHTGTCTREGCDYTVKEDCTFVDEVCEVCKGKQPVYAINTSVENATIATPTGDLPGTALHGTELAFTITPAEGFVVTEVKVNGETVEAVEGVYTVVVTAIVNIDVTTQEESTVPAEPTIVAQFTLGEDGSAKHVDGNSTTQYTETQNGYTLKFTNSANVYSKAVDATGNGCLKLGTGSKAGSFSFTVPESVTIVKIYVAGYKAKTATVTINNVETELTCHSDDGEYDCIEIDVSAVKTVEFKVSSGYRCMINTIEFYE